jgi:LTXXQ motif family protein
MRKALIPMLVSLALCGAATTALVMSSARAQPGPRKPVMIADAAAPRIQMAANDTPGAPPPRSLRQPSPQAIAARIAQMCNDGFARQSGQLAYLEASLQLTAAERPLFQHWKDAKLDIAHRQADACAQRPLPQRMAQRGADTNTPETARAERPSPADRMAREEDNLKQRLADLEAERPALEAFYNALSPQQKNELQHVAMRGPIDGRGPGRGMRHHMFADAAGPHMPMDGGAMGRPPGPPDSPPSGR